MDTNTQDFTPGDRVELHPATDLWMRGARYGTVSSVGRTRVRVFLDAASRFVSLRPQDIERVTW